MSIAEKKLFQTTAITSVIFFAAAMLVIVYFGINKTIEIVNVAQDAVENESAIPVTQTPEGEKDRLLFEQDSDAEYLCIPLREKMNAEDITIENHYMDSELVILMNGIEESFYAEHALTGSRECITDGTFEASGEGVTLHLLMDGIYEYRTVLENNNLYISFLNPREMYERIVVIDPYGGGADSGNTAEGLAEKDIALDVSKKLKARLDDSGIKAYYTRMDDVNPSEENRVRLANETKADLYIVIGAERNSDPSVYGVSATYNDEYFIPGFGSIELSDLLLRSVTTQVKGKALGLRKASVDEYTLRHATVPVSRIGVGCLTNKQEAILLGREDYREKIAEGIFDAIMEVYEK